MPDGLHCAEIFVQSATKASVCARYGALLKTIGRKTGKARRTLVGNGRVGQQFWIVAEHGARYAILKGTRTCAGNCARDLERAGTRGMQIC
jgi:F420H(2)-dependent quinone reductase